MTNLTERNWAFSSGLNDGRADPDVRTVSICDTQPVTAEGIRTLLSDCPDLKFEQATDSLSRAMEMLRESPPSVVVVDKAFGIQTILEWLTELRTADADLSTRTGIVIWGVSVTEAEALRFLQAGARGILRKTATIPMLVACLRSVAAGRTWMEDCVFRDSGRSERYPRSELTAREQQVLELVEQGFKNKDIAVDLGIRPGTVKIQSETYLRENRCTRPLRPGIERIERARAGLGPGLNTLAEWH
jgi:DNA-binding NarL/FixJ family response regulator